MGIGIDWWRRGRSWRRLGRRCRAVGSVPSSCALIGIDFVNSKDEGEVATGHFCENINVGRLPLWRERGRVAYVGKVGAEATDVLGGKVGRCVGNGVVGEEI